MTRARYEMTFRCRGGRLGIGAVVAMVAASQQWFIVWALNRDGTTPWRQVSTLASRRDAREFLNKLITANRGTFYDPDHGSTSGCEWKILPGGVEP